MKYTMLCFIINFLCFTIQVFCLQEDYFWRDYTGNIPGDAVVGGKDINSNDIYIGQAYIKNEGLMVVQIYRGVKEVYAPIKGVKKVDKYIKILCGPQYNFYWLSANNTNLHLNLIDKHAVIGGHEDGLGYINIGRISHQGEIKIGKINSFAVENANFFFVENKEKEHLIHSYEILIYDGSNTNTGIRITIPIN